ncbi:hypothetical protein CMUS01_00404 [Colletotrichum musicola]|uniref:Uncharacterized protein n=1 Tax=Colletotrichum musicola TaxID=2175873 RepID=A0A8H6NYY7_9PEZI|nr:hypothetical protein CMUS01_00404 [Colletotrichum musicola]
MGTGVMHLALGIQEQEQEQEHGRPTGKGKNCSAAGRGGSAVGRRCAVVAPTTGAPSVPLPMHTQAPEAASKQARRTGVKTFR